MKKNYLLIASFIAAVIMTVSCSQNNNNTENTEAQEVAEATTSSKTYSISAGAVIHWLGTKVTGKHDGTVDIKSGEISVDDGHISAANIVFDMNTITVLDLKDEEMNAKLTNHLKHSDFFGVENHSEAMFEVTSIEKQDDGMHLVKGNMTFKGIAKNIEFPANVKITDDKVHVKATAVLDRTLWDIKYGSSKFFSDLGDKVIHDDFTIDFDVEASI